MSPNYGKFKQGTTKRGNSKLHLEELVFSLISGIITKDRLVDTFTHMEQRLIEPRKPIYGQKRTRNNML